LLVALAAVGTAAPASAEPAARPSVASDDLQLSSTFDGLGFDVELRFDATLDESCDTGWVKPVLYVGDGTGFGDDSEIVRSLGWRELTVAGIQSVAFRVTEPGTYGVALTSPDASEACVEGPAALLADAPSAEITLVRTATANLVAPAITGVARVGETLTATPGTWQGPMLAYSYEWLRSGAAIDGANTSSYTIQPDDVAKQVSVRVTATSPHDSASAVSSATLAVTVGGLGSYTPVITGTKVVGQVLSVTVPDGNTYTYQWYRGSTKILGATGATYKLVAADGGLTIKVTTVASRFGYAPLTRTSAATGTILKKLTAPVPTLSGAARVGTKLTAVTGAWGPAPVTLRYQWSVDGVPVAGQTGATFVPRPADIDSSISVAVTGSKAGYASVVKTSADSAPVTEGVISLPAPTISGTVRQGSKLTAVIGTTVPTKSKLTFAYQWLASGAVIDGATASTFTPGADLIGKTLAVRVTASTPYYDDRVRTSASTVKVVGLLSASVPVLTGTARIDKTLCATAGSWTPGTSLAYAWYLNGAKVATTSRCIAITSTSWEGMRLVVKVTGSKSGYLTRTVASASSAPIVVPNRTGPISLNSCPAWAPIKGNKSSMIYHMPGQRFYDVTNPEDCFRTETAAVAAGYRKAKV